MKGYNVERAAVIAEIERLEAILSDPEKRAEVIEELKVDFEGQQFHLDDIKQNISELVAQGADQRVIDRALEHLYDEMEERDVIDGQIREVVNLDEEIYVRRLYNQLHQIEEAMLAEAMAIIPRGEAVHAPEARYPREAVPGVRAPPD